MNHSTKALADVIVGLDLGDKYSDLFVMAEDGEILSEERVKTDPKAFRKRLGKFESPVVVAMEAGTHSMWASELVRECGHESLVANPRQVALIFQSRKKSDKIDPEVLARIARLDPELLAPIEHRSSDAHADLSVLRSRDLLVSLRASAINHMRGSVKTVGQRLPRCSAHAFANKVAPLLPEELRPALDPVLTQIANLTASIRTYDKQLENLCEEKYPETARLRQIKGVGPLTALAYVLTLEDPSRFRKSRQVGAYLGLVPKLDQSGEHSPQLRITKAGNEHLRRLLVTAAHYVLGAHGPDTDLRRHGEAIATRGGKNAKKRAVVAVARKLSVLLHRLWCTGEVYEPLRNSRLKENSLRRKRA